MVAPGRSRVLRGQHQTDHCVLLTTRFALKFCKRCLLLVLKQSEGREKYGFIIGELSLKVCRDTGLLLVHELSLKVERDTGLLLGRELSLKVCRDTGLLLGH